MSQTAPTVEQAGALAVIDDPVRTEAAPLRPVSAQERIQLIDVLRGFALFGVLLANMAWLSGDWVVMTKERAASLPTAAIDPYAKYLINFFVDMKANTIFAFLFGLGFSVQMMRAEERGQRIAPVYARRLLILLALGLAHMLLLWYGDILHLYALMGFALLFFRRRSTTTLLATGATLAVLPWALFMALPWFFANVGGPEARAEIEAFVANREQGFEPRLAVFQHGGYFDVLREHFTFNLEEYVFSGFVFCFAFYVTGRFLVGLYVGRRRLLHDAPAHLPLFRRLLWWGLAVGVVGNAAFTALSVLEDRGAISMASGWMAAGQAVAAVGIPAMSCFYVSAIVLLYQRERWQRRLLWLAPVGRMALTNYLMQTLFHLFIFYGYAGLGLIGKIGTSLCIPLSLAIFAFQIVLSRWWLARFRFGPMEWLWRTLTYGRRQPMRLAAEQSA
ncbi:MAG TPA: DUF418 domain-containing protein [Pyrinomonadaceae bacterium]|nr:DUF418 domain-containing protein [Pyrinomonadaceae bacterium]